MSPGAFIVLTLDLSRPPRRERWARPEIRFRPQNTILGYLHICTVGEGQANRESVCMQYAGVLATRSPASWGRREANNPKKQAILQSDRLTRLPLASLDPGSAPKPRGLAVPCFHHNMRHKVGSGNQRTNLQDRIRSIGMPVLYRGSLVIQVGSYSSSTGPQPQNKDSPDLVHRYHRVLLSCWPQHGG